MWLLSLPHCAIIHLHLCVTASQKTPLPVLQHSAVCTWWDCTEYKTTFDILVNIHTVLMKPFLSSLHGREEVFWVWTSNVLIVQGVITHTVQQTHRGMCTDQQFGTWPTLPNGWDMFYKMQSSITNVNTKFTWLQELLCANYRNDRLVLWMYLIILFSHLVSES